MPGQGPCYYGTPPEDPMGPPRAPHGTPPGLPIGTRGQETDHYCCSFFVCSPNKKVVYKGPKDQDVTWTLSGHEFAFR